MPKKANEHLRRTFLAGIFAAVPIAITYFVVWWIDERTRVISTWLFHLEKPVPFVGILVAILAIYATGLMATTLLGRMFLKFIDSILTRVPMIRQLYIAWKQIALTPGGVDGTFSKVVLVPDESNQMRMLAFTSGRPIPGESGVICIYIPFAPNPTSGKLCFIEASRCIFPDLSPEEAFKIILSAGNYVPPLGATVMPIDLSPTVRGGELDGPGTPRALASPRPGPTSLPL